MKQNIRASYTAANTFPVKLFLNDELLHTIREHKKIPPVHVQLNPTNKCNFNCKFCSCSARDKKLEMSFEDIMEIMNKAKKCGCQAVTITGGGEPLMHPRIKDIISGIHQLGIEIGLVTNGVFLSKLTENELSKITWCRISSGDNEEYTKYGIQNNKYTENLEEVVKMGKNVDWAFSHVVSRNPNYDTIKKIIEFANDHNFTHVRLVSDLLDLEAVSDMSVIKKKLQSMGIDDNIVIYQGRKEFTRGTKKCYISLLKPVITPDGYIVACCGWQYRHKNPSRDYDIGENMGLAKDIDKVYNEQRYFDGSNCYRCYYKEYNDALTMLLSDVKHKKFV